MQVHCSCQTGTSICPCYTGAERGLDSGSGDGPGNSTEMEGLFAARDV